MCLEGDFYVYRRHSWDNYPHRSHRLGCAQGVNDLARSCEQADSTRLDYAATRAPITSGPIIVWGALGFLLSIARAAFIPIVLAWLFALVLSGSVEALHKLRLPCGVSASLILVLVLADMAGGVELMWKPAQEWFAIRILPVEGKLTPDGAIAGTEHFGYFLDPMSQSTRMLGKFLNRVEPPARLMPVAIRDCHRVRDRSGSQLALCH